MLIKQCTFFIFVFKLDDPVGITALSSFQR